MQYQHQTQVLPSLAHPLAHLTSIGGRARKNSVHQPTCHFILHLINQVSENPSKMIVVRAQGNRSAIFRRLRGRNSAENLLLIEGRKAFLVLCVRASAFADGREEEEVRALWKAARQKVRVSRRKRRVRKHHKKQATGNMSIIPQCIGWLSARRFRRKAAAQLLACCPPP